MFIDTSQAAKDLEAGLKGLVIAAAGGGAALTNSIKTIKEDFDFEGLDGELKKAKEEILAI